MRLKRSLNFFSQGIQNLKLDTLCALDVRLKENLKLKMKVQGQNCA